MPRRGLTTEPTGSIGLTPTDDHGDTLIYDGWNRLIQVKNSAGTVLKTYSYDGLGRRITDSTGTATDLYYSVGGQVLEERQSSVVKVQYVWGTQYSDQLILRDRDANGSGGDGLEQRIYALQDATFNVTGLVNTSGSVLERFVLDSYGKYTVDSSSWSSTSDSYSWNRVYQGLQYDSTIGWYMNRARIYSPTLMRFGQEDPLGYVDGMDDYLSRADNPLGFGDPTGEAAQPPQLGLGTDAHKIIGAAYTFFHPGAYTNYYPLEFIVGQMEPKPDLRKLGAAGVLKPDIMTNDKNPSNMHDLYEIKSMKTGWGDAFTELLTETLALNHACVKAEAGPVDALGVTGLAPLGPATALMWFCPIPGVILYDVVARPPRRVPFTVPVPVPVPAPSPRGTTISPRAVVVPVAAGAAAISAGVVIWEIAKYTAAIGGAAETGGASSGLLFAP